MSADGFDVSEYPELEAGERRALRLCALPLVALGTATGCVAVLALAQAGFTSAALWFTPTSTAITHELQVMAVTQWLVPTAALTLAVADLGLAVACVLAHTQRLGSAALADVRLVVLAHPTAILGIPLVHTLAQLGWGIAQ